MPSWLGYLLSTLFIGTWWACAFLRQSPSEAAFKQIEFKVQQEIAIAGISTISRDELISALSGNLDSIYRLILQWDMDAQILQHQKVERIRRLPQEQLLTVCKLTHQLKQGSKEQIETLRSSYRASWVEDDNAKIFSLDKPYSKVLPQTFASAAILLALKGSSGITALPRGFEEWQSYFPDTPFTNIRMDSGRMYSEAVAQAKPEIAFVAHYSNPSAIEALKQQGLDVFTLVKLDSPEEVCDAILRIGHAVDRAPEAFLLATFVEAALLHFDNCLASLQMQTSPLENPLMLYCYGNWYLPTKKSVTHLLLDRMGWQVKTEKLLDSQSPNQWLQPINFEQLISYNPSHLIVACSSEQHVPLPTFFTPIPTQYIDANVQQWVSQHIILAYYDLFQSYIKHTSPCGAPF